MTLVPNGGGFGGKDLSVQGHAAVAAHAVGRPVRSRHARRDRMHPRHPIWMDYTVGCDASKPPSRSVRGIGAYASVGMKVLEPGRPRHGRVSRRRPTSRLWPPTPTISPWSHARLRCQSGHFRAGELPR